VEKSGRAGHTTDDNIVRRMRIACWITKATDTRLEYAIFYRFSTAVVVQRMRWSVTLHSGTSNYGHSN
jgi:hypothetical protein